MGEKSYKMNSLCNMVNTDFKNIWKKEYLGESSNYSIISKTFINLKHLSDYSYGPVINDSCKLNTTTGYVVRTFCFNTLNNLNQNYITLE